MDALTRSLLLGLDQAPPGASGLPTDALVEHQDPALAALLRAGSAAVYREAAQQTLVGIPRPEPAPQDPRPPLPAKALPLLLEGLNRRRRPQLAALVHEASSRGMRLPSAALPRVLDLHRAELRETVRPLLGPRAAWLAAQRPEFWGWVLEGEQHQDEQDPVWDRLFEEGDLRTRAQALKVLRRRDPDAARERLAQGLAQEPAGDRLVLVQALTEGLGPADEDFLEARLRDRSKKVREAAAGLLALLPDSALSQRMWGRAWPLVSLVDGELELELPPEKQPEDEKRDGVASEALPGMGPRQARASRILGLLDPSGWESRFDRDPQQLLAICRHDEDLAVVVGFTEGALRFGQREWAGPLFAWWSQAPKSQVFTAPAMKVRLVPLLEEQECVVLLRALFARDALGPAGVALLERMPRPWPRPVAQALLQHLARQERLRQVDPWLREHLSELAWALPFDLLPEHLDLQGADLLFEHFAARRRMNAIFSEV